MSEFASGVLLSSILWVFFLVLFWVRIQRDATKEREAYEKERKQLLKLRESPEAFRKEADPVKRVLWMIGDRTEVDLGEGVFTLAKIIDFDNPDSTGREEARIRFENSQGDKGFWEVLVDNLRKPREGLPEVPPCLPVSEEKEKA